MKQPPQLPPPITLVNPKGEKRDLGNVAFYALKKEFAGKQPVKQWAAQTGLDVARTTTIDRFLSEHGYTVIRNWDTKRKED